MQVQLALAGVVHGGAAIAHRAVPVVLRLGQLLPLAAAVEGDLRLPMRIAQLLEVQSQEHCQAFSVPLHLLTTREPYQFQCQTTCRVCNGLRAVQTTVLRGLIM